MANVIGQRYEIYNYENVKEIIPKGGEIVFINNAEGFKNDDIIQLSADGKRSIRELFEDWRSGEGSPFRTKSAQDAIDAKEKQDRIKGDKNTLASAKKYTDDLANITIKKAERGVANGVAALDEFGKVAAGQIDIEDPTGVRRFYGRGNDNTYIDHRLLSSRRRLEVNGTTTMPVSVQHSTQADSALSANTRSFNNDIITEANKSATQIASTENIYQSLIFHLLYPPTKASSLSVDWGNITINIGNSVDPSASHVPVNSMGIIEWNYSLNIIDNYWFTRDEEYLINPEVNFVQNFDFMNTHVAINITGNQPTGTIPSGKILVYKICAELTVTCNLRGIPGSIQTRVYNVMSLYWANA
ncbi:MAG: hypothetical protein FWD26_04955 [Treponema sp.]|nr:hypothetical protein [Treponema sp.]